MTVEVYKPLLKPRPVQLSPIRFEAKPKRTINTSVGDLQHRNIREAYRPVQPRLDLMLGIEAMTHPDEPSFAELEAVILAEQLQEAKRYPLP